MEVTGRYDFPLSALGSEPAHSTSHSARVPAQYSNQYTFSAARSHTISYD